VIICLNELDGSEIDVLTSSFLFLVRYFFHQITCGVSYWHFTVRIATK
jgi:hypothetical protein